MSGKRLGKLRRPPRTIHATLTPQSLARLPSLDRLPVWTLPAPRRRWSARGLLRRVHRLALLLVGLTFLWAALVVFGLIAPAGSVMWALQATGLLAENRELGNRIMLVGASIVPVGVVLLAWGRGWPARIGSFLGTALLFAFGYTFFLAGVFALGAIVLLHLVLRPFGVDPEPWYPAIYLAFATGWSGYAIYLLFAPSTSSGGGYVQSLGGGDDSAFSFPILATAYDRFTGDPDDSGASGDWGSSSDSSDSGGDSD